MKRIVLRGRKSADDRIKSYHVKPTFLFQDTMWSKYKNKISRIFHKAILSAAHSNYFKYLSLALLFAY